MSMSGDSLTGNQYDNAQLGGDDRKDKFLRLMGGGKKDKSDAGSKGEMTPEIPHEGSNPTKIESGQDLEKEENTGVKENTETEEVIDVKSANAWEKATSLGDNSRKNKFLRLMGASKKEHTGKFVIGDRSSANSDRIKVPQEKELEDKLEDQYNQGLELRVTGAARRHKGLGFQEPKPPEPTDEEKNEDGKDESKDSGRIDESQETRDRDRRNMEHSSDSPHRYSDRGDRGNYRQHGDGNRDYNNQRSDDYSRGNRYSHSDRSSGGRGGFRDRSQDRDRDNYRSRNDYRNHADGRQNNTSYDQHQQQQNVGGSNSGQFISQQQQNTQNPNQPVAGGPYNTNQPTVGSAYGNHQTQSDYTYQPQQQPWQQQQQGYNQQFTNPPPPPIGAYNSPSAVNIPAQTMNTHMSGIPQPAQLFQAAASAQGVYNNILPQKPEPEYTLLAQAPPPPPPLAADPTAVSNTSQPTNNVGGGGGVGNATAATASSINYNYQSGIPTSYFQQPPPLQPHNTGQQQQYSSSSYTSNSPAHAAAVAATVAARPKSMMNFVKSSDS